MQFRFHRHWLAIVAFGLVWIVLSGSPVAASWTIETVDTPGNAGWDISVSTDLSARPHIGCYATGSTTRYAQRNSGTWTVGPNLSGSYADFSLDKFGRPYMLYRTTSGLKLSRLGNNGTWTTSTVSTLATGENGALAFDSLNRPHVAFNDTSSSQLMHTWFNGASWNASAVAYDLQFQYGNAVLDMALDKNDKSQFIWTKEYQSGGFPLWHSNELADGGYESRQVDSTVGGQSIAVDRQNVVHIGYASNSTAVKHATFNSSTGTWTKETAYTSSGSKKLGGIAFDKNGEVNMSFVSTGTTDTLQRTVKSGSSWTTAPVTSWASSLGGPEASTIAVDRAGGVHVGYTDDSENVSYAYQAGLATAVKNIIASSDGAATIDYANPANNTFQNTSTPVLQKHTTQHEHRGVMEFSLADIPRSASIVSTSLEIQVNLLSQPGNPASYLDLPSIRLYGYAGDGTAALSDALLLDLQIGDSGEVYNTGSLTTYLDPGFVESVLQSGATHFGLVALGNDNHDQLGYWGHWATGVTLPTLHVSYAVPEPSCGVFLLIALLGAAGCKRRKRALFGKIARG